MYNTIYNENCLDTMSNRLGENSVDLVVTSPPYDNMRTYHHDIHKSWGEHVWKPIIKSLYRVMKPGGVVVWIVGDATINGSESGTSFQQALWAKECGFNLHDTMIYTKGGQGACGSNYAYLQDFEYMFVFSKGKPKSINLIYDRKNRYKTATKTFPSKRRNPDGTTNKSVIKPVDPNEPGRRFNVWEYHNKNEQPEKVEHPAPFPDSICRDHIISWSNPGDLVYDPFMGSGTTARMCIETERNYVGSELSQEFIDLANRLIGKTAAPLF